MVLRITKRAGRLPDSMPRVPWAPRLVAVRNKSAMRIKADGCMRESTPRADCWPRGSEGWRATSVCEGPSPLSALGTAPVVMLFVVPAIPRRLESWGARKVRRKALTTEAHRGALSQSSTGTAAFVCKRLFGKRSQQRRSACPPSASVRPLWSCCSSYPEFRILWPAGEARKVPRKALTTRRTERPHDEVTLR